MNLLEIFRYGKNELDKKTNTILWCILCITWIIDWNKYYLNDIDMVNKEILDFINKELFEDEGEGKYFHELAGILVSSGYNTKEIKDLLSGLFYNVANLYGG